MKQLMLLRHGKSDWGADFGRDHDRPLAERGFADAKRMGRLITASRLLPDLVLSSSATRALRTAQLAAKAGSWGCPVQSTRELYEASPSPILTLIQTQGSQVNTLLLVGHNPTWEHMVQWLIGWCGNLRFPTAALALVGFAITDWEELRPGEGTLLWFVIPRLMKKVGF